MTDTGGLAILFAWLIFAFLLAVLAFLVLRGSGTAGDEVEHPDERGEVR